MGLQTVEVSPKRLYVGVDVGGTKVAAAVLEPNGGVIWQARVATNTDDQGALLAQIDSLVERAVAFCASERPGECVAGVGIGVPGSVDRDHGVAMRAVNLPWKDAPVKDYLEEKRGIPVFLENDTNAGALGELWFGGWGPVDHLVYIALGTGVGGGVIINRRLYRGMGKAGEVGHIVVDPAGRHCKCGTRGCLEALASGPAIAARAQAALETGRESLLTSLVRESAEVTAEHVSAAAWRGDELALELMGAIARDLATGLVSVCRLFDPELVVLGGGVAAAGDRFLELIRSEMLQLCPDSQGFVGRVRLSRLGQDSGVVGAAAVVRDELAEPQRPVESCRPEEQTQARRVCGA